MITFRHLKKNRTYSLINIGGLAIGMAASLIIILFVMDEMNFDRFHEKAERIYRVGPQFGHSIDDRAAFTPPPLASALRSDFPEIQEVTRLLLWKSNDLVRYKENQYVETHIIYADSSVFNIFTFHWIVGNQKTALTRPNQVVITDKMAVKYFGQEGALGKILQIEDEDVMVTGVVEAYPKHSHFQFDFIMSMVSLDLHDEIAWMSHCLSTYVLLPQGFPPEQLQAKLPDFIAEHYGPIFFKETGVDYREHIMNDKNFYTYWLQPLLDIHLNGDIYYLTDTEGDMKTVMIFSTIALLIMVIACMNYINLSTARSEKRAREVGIRKVMGTKRGQLFIQFFSESIVMCIFALCVALCIVYLVIPYFNKYLNRELQVHLIENPMLLVVFLGFAIVVGIGAGLYPAIYLTAFQPITVFKGRISRNRGELRLRNGLVVFQFLVSMLLMIGTIMIEKQLRYVRQAELGFNEKNILVLNRCWDLGDQKATFKQSLLQNPDILVVSNTNSTPGRHFEPNSYVLDGRPKTQEFLFWTIFADYEFAKLLDLEILEGRFFTEKPPTNDIAVVINETAVREHHLDNPIGQHISIDEKKGRVVGVVKDFHFQSLHHPIEPMMIAQLNGYWGGRFCIKLRRNDIKQTIDYIRDRWHTFTGGRPFQFSLLYDQLIQLYESDQKSGTLVFIFSGMAICIACLGIFGLAASSSEKRTKEVGVRKVVGATDLQILILLIGDVVRYVGISFVIAIPMAIYFMNQWLQNFAYRTAISWWIFLLTGAGTMWIALLTVIWQTIRTARANPVEALRYE